MRILLILLTRWRVRGRENAPGEGPVLIVANHLNATDPFLLAASLGRKVTFMAKEELFHSRLISLFLRKLGVFPVRRGRGDRQALHQAWQLLAQGQALVMFPEGRRSKTAQLQAAFSGPALIALRSGAPILPIGISGTEKIKGVAWLLQRPQLAVNIGQLFYLTPVSGRLTKAKRAEYTSSIMGHITELLPAEYRGELCEGRESEA